jgi:predicted amidohydrolase
VSEVEPGGAAGTANELAVALVQHDIAWEDRDTTLARVEPLVRDAIADGAGLVLLPELFAVGFSMATDRVAEPAGEGGQPLGGRAAGGSGAWVGGSVPELATGDARPTNTFVLAGPGGEVHRYAKVHPFSYGEEDRHYAPGDATITVEVGPLRLSPAICYDLRFADQFWSQAEATDCYAVVANWPAARAAHWRALLVARAIENQAWVLGVNRVGPSGDGLAHAGGSIVVDPLGEVVAEAGADPTVLTATLDAARVGEVRARFPFLADRR